MPGPGPVPVLSGEQALPDARHAEDEHLYCPTCAIHEPWVGAVLAAFNGVTAGLPLSEVAPEPTAALVDAVTLISSEVDARTAQRVEDRTQ